MGGPAEKLSLTPFLDWENAQPCRHEFLDGAVFALTGGRRAHGEVAGNVFAALKGHLRGSPCRAYIQGMKLQVADNACFILTCSSPAIRLISAPRWCWARRC